MWCSRYCWYWSFLTVSVQGGVDWHLRGDVCTGICGWCWSEPVSKVVFSAVFPSSLSMFVGFLLGLVLAGRLNPSDLPLPLVTLLLEDMTAYNKRKDYTQNARNSILGIYFVTECSENTKIT